MMAGFGNTEDQISQLIGVSLPTLRLHYRAELDLGHIKANNAVAANLFRQATKDDPKSVRAAEFWLQCRAGWSIYSPKPTGPEVAPEKPLGKKEQAAIDAKQAEQGTGWSDLIH